MKDVVESSLGVALTVTGTAISAATLNDILTTVSLIITILGAVWSFIVLPLIKWHRRAKADGKITKEEIDEAIDIVNDGIERVSEIDKKENK